MTDDKQPTDTASRRTAGLNRGGRPKGSANKFTVHAKEAMQMAFDQLGGVERLVEWARADDKNLGDFYKLYARLIPMEVTGKDGKDLVPISALDAAREFLFATELAQRQQSTTQH